MTITHAISTERLVNVLQSIALKQQTGCLTVAREQGQMQGAEKGNIFFERGDTVFALTAQESGETALHHMLNWKHVSCTFIEGMRYMPEESAGSFGSTRRITRDLSDDTSSSRLSRSSSSSQPAQTLNMRRLSAIKAAEGRQTPPIGIPALPKNLSATPPVEMVETHLLPAINLADIPTPLPPEIPLHDPPTVQCTMFPQRDTDKGEQIIRSDQKSDFAGYEYADVPMGVTSIFRALPSATAPDVLSRMDRRERVVLLLLNGKRTLHDVAILVHRREVDVARTVVRLLKQRYVEHIGAH